MTSVVVVDLLCNSPFYCGPFTRALAEVGLDAELASPRFYLDQAYLDSYRRAAWIRDLGSHVSGRRLIRRTARSIDGFVNFARLLMRIRHRRYDVVHVQWVPLEDRPSPFMRLLRRQCDRAGSLLVLTIHDAVPHDRDPTDRKSLRRNTAQAHRLVALSQNVARQLAIEIGDNVPIAVVPHGPLFADQTLPPRAEAGVRLGVPSSPVVLFIGLIKAYKGLDLLAEAWDAVREEFPSASLLVVGKVVDETAAIEVRELQRHAGVRVEARYVSTSELLDYHAVADVIVLPYRRISQSGALMTAVSLGRPTVVTPIAGLQEQVSDIESSIVADEVSGDAIARALLASLRRRDDLQAAADRDRGAIAGSTSGWAEIGAAMERLYREGLMERRRPD